MSYFKLEDIIRDAKALSIIAITGIGVGLGIARFTLTEDVLPTKEEISFEEVTDAVTRDPIKLNKANSYQEEKK